MSKFTRPTGSVDVLIEEIPQGNFRVKIIGTVVNLTPSTIVINDGTGTVTLDLGKNSYDSLDIKLLGRFICEVTKREDNIQGELITWNPIEKELVDKYRKLVEIERRLPK